MEITNVSADHWLDVLRRGLGQTDLLHACREMNPAVAVILIAAGIIFLLWGYYAFRALVTLNAAAMGAWLGTMVGKEAGGALLNLAGDRLRYNTRDSLINPEFLAVGDSAIDWSERLRHVVTQG